MAKKTAKRWVAGFDVHGDRQDKGAVKVFHEFSKYWKPELRISGGDIFDFRSLRKGATEEEKREKVAEDVDAGIEFIRTLKPTHFLCGNHDQRIFDAAACDDGKLADFASYLIEDIKEAIGAAPILPYDKRAGVLKIQTLKFIHGYNSGITAARLAAQVYGSVIMGHIHTVDSYSIPGLERRVGRAVGCLCQLSQDYNRAQMQTLRQAHGFAYGILNGDGSHVVFQAEPINGTWYFPTELKEMR